MQDLMDLRFTVWPRLKVRLRYYWWILRFGCKKHIPRGIVIRALEKSIAKMEENMRKGQDAAPIDMHEEARLVLREFRTRTDDLATELREALRKNQD